MAIAELMFPQSEIVDHTYYPSGDGEPMAETQLHIRAIRELADYFDDLLAGRADVWMGVDQFWYWEKGRAKSRCAPDIMLVFGVPREPARRSFFTWLEGNKAPSFICEFSSEHTWRDDLDDKFLLYQKLGVKEYFLFDPEYRYLDPALRGFRLRSGKYRPIRASADGSIESKTLGVRLIADGPLVRLIDPQTGRIIPSRIERLEEQRAKAEAAQKELAEKEAEIMRLRGLLEKGKGSINGSTKS